MNGKYTTGWQLIRISSLHFKNEGWTCAAIFQYPHWPPGTYEVFFEIRNYLSKKFHIFSTHEIYFTMKNIANYGMYYSIVGNFEANCFEVISQW